MTINDIEQYLYSISSNLMLMGGSNGMMVQHMLSVIQSIRGLNSALQNDNINDMYRFGMQAKMQELENTFSLYAAQRLAEHGMSNGNITSPFGMQMQQPMYSPMMSMQQPMMQPMPQMMQTPPMQNQMAQPSLPPQQAFQPQPNFQPAPQPQQQQVQQSPVFQANIPSSVATEVEENPTKVEEAIPQPQPTTPVPQSVSQPAPQTPPTTSSPAPQPAMQTADENEEDNDDGDDGDDGVDGGAFMGMGNGGGGGSDAPAEGRDYLLKLLGGA